MYCSFLSLITVGLRGGKQDGGDGQGKDDGKWKDPKKKLCFVDI